MKRAINRVIDFLYFPFIRKYIPYDLFRYGACGAGNLGLDFVLFFLFFHLVFRKQDFNLGIVVLSPHIAALFSSFFITFFTGFWLMKNIAFRQSPLRNHVQLFRYLLVVGVNVLINYLGMKLLVDAMHIYPTPSKVMVTCVATAVSYFSQKYFTFRGSQVSGEM